MNNTLRAPMRKIRRWIMCLCFMWVTILHAQNRIEYFWNTDPGIGRGNILIGNSETFNAEIPTDTLPIGVNLLGIRALDGQYASPTLLRMVFNALPFGEDNTKLEYFWDEDPGIGRATPYPVALGGETTVLNMSLVTDEIPAGIHTLGLRLGYGSIWTPTVRNLVAVLPQNGKVDRIEYFWDKDPGIGQAIPYAVETDEETALVNMSILTDTLSGGMHLLGLRIGNGVSWSQTYTQLVGIAPNGGAVDAVEYFWDEDPGLGKATRYPLSDTGSEVSVSLSVMTDGLSRGVHMLGIRSHSVGWSTTLYKTVVVGAEGNPVEIVEYFWDEDPGYGNATPLKFQAGEPAIVDEEIPVPEDYGSHVLVIRARSGGIWSSALVQNVCVNASPDFTLAKDTVCCGEEIAIMNLTTGATDETVYEWDMNGDGEPDMVGGEDLTYTYDEAGEYMVTLSVKTVGECEATCAKPIVVLGTTAPSVSLSASSQEGCDGDTICFVAKALDAGFNPEFEWLINGETVAYGKSDTLQTNTLTDGAQVQVRVYSSNPCCQVEVAESAILTISVKPLPEVSMEPYFPVYTTESAFVLDGGFPAGGTYYVDGEEATYFDPQEHEPGVYLISYSYEAPSGCQSMVTQRLEVREPNEHSLLKGDVNKDEKVDTEDIPCAIDLIYGHVSPTWNKATADINEDDDLDVRDVVGIAGIILGDDRVEGTTDTQAAENGLAVNDVSVPIGTSAVDLTFELSDRDVVSGVQFDMLLPDGVDLESKTEGLTVDKKWNATNNVYTFLAYSENLESLGGRFDVRATLPVNLLKGAYDLLPENCIMSGPDMSSLEHQIQGGRLFVGTNSAVENLLDEGMSIQVGQRGLNVLHAENGTLMITDMLGRFILATEIDSDAQFVPLSELVTGVYVAEVRVEEKIVRLKFIWK